MRYSRHLDYLKLLIAELARKEEEGATRDGLAKSLALDPSRVEAALDGFPTLFRREPPAGPRRWRDRLPRWLVPRSRPAPETEPEAATEPEPTYRLQIRDKSDEPLPAIVERRAEAERAHARIVVPVAIAALAALLIALLVSGLPMAGPDEPAGAGLQAAVGATGQSRSESGAGASAGSGRSTWQGQPPVAVTCNVCPPPQAGAPSNEGSRTGERPDEPTEGTAEPSAPAGPGAGGGWLSFGMLGLAGVGLAAIVVAWPMGREARAPLVTLGGALGVAGSIAAWAQPALTVKAPEPGLHDAVAGTLMAILVVAIVTLVGGFVSRKAKWPWAWLAPVATIAILAGLVWWPESSRANFARDYLGPFLGASGPERMYAGLLVLGGLTGLFLAVVIILLLRHHSRPEAHPGPSKAKKGTG